LDDELGCNEQDHNNMEILYKMSKHNEKDCNNMGKLSMKHSFNDELDYNVLDFDERGLIMLLLEKSS